MVPMVKRATPDQKQFIREGMEDGRFDNATTALNSLQEVPYTVNEYIVDAVDWVRKRGLKFEGHLFPHTDGPGSEDAEGRRRQVLADSVVNWRERRKIKAHNRQASGKRSKLKRTLEGSEGTA